MNAEYSPTQDTAASFATRSRIHMGLAVGSLARSLEFYRTLLGQKPSKVRPLYAKFEVAEPPLNLALNEVSGTTGRNNVVAHFGIQVKSTEAVREISTRLAEAGLPTKIEENVTCCYAVQNKVWATDPDGHRWEVYVVLDDEGAHHHSSALDCCPQMPAVMEAVQRGDAAAAKSAFEKAGGMSACSCLTAPTK